MLKETKDAQQLTPLYNKKSMLALAAKHDNPIIYLYKLGCL